MTAWATSSVISACVLASEMILPENARANSATDGEERTVALSTACTVASVFFTR